MMMIRLETHTRSQTPHFMSYPMDMTWILQHQVYFLANVISMSYPCHICFFKKRYIWIYLVYSKLKKLFLVYTWYIFSCHMLSMSYPRHKFVRLSGAGPQMKFSRKLHCGPSSAYHCTAFIKHNKIYLPLPRPRTPPLPPALDGDAAGSGSCAPADPRQRGAAGAGAAGAGAGS